MYPKAIKALIEDFAKLPGIGDKTAERLVLQIINKNDEYLQDFAKHLSQLKENVKTCETCGLLVDLEGCFVCSNQERQKDVIMILADTKDAYALEKTQSFDGVYHILGGLINFARGIDHNDLNIESLLSRLQAVKEVVIATNATVEGEITAAFLKNILTPYPIIVSRLAYGIPVGLDLKYADLQTLALAVKNRQKF